MDHLTLVSYVKRGEETHLYSAAAAARSYLMFHEPLLEWIVDQMNNQETTGKWENVAELLAACDYPNSAWIALGAGEYTEWGEKNFLQPKDEALVVVYDERTFPDGPDAELIEALFDDGHAPPGLICVHQTLV